MSHAGPLILGGRPAQELVNKIVEQCRKIPELELEYCEHEIRSFPDTERKPRIGGNVRGRHVVVVQCACAFQGCTVDTALRELYLFNDALGRASVGEVTVLLPYFPYARQDRKDEGRTSVSVSLIVRELELSLESVPVKRVVSLDLHNPAIEGVFRAVPFNPLTALTELIPRLAAGEYTTLVSPDTGGAPRTEEALRILQHYLVRGTAMSVAYKRRQSASEEVEIPWVTGDDIRGKNVAIVDDIIATGGTAVQLAGTLREKLGANRVALAAPHAVCARRAWERLGSEMFDDVLVSDTLPVKDRLPDTLPAHWQVVSVAPLLALAIKEIHTHGSLTSLWKRRPPLGECVKF